MTMPVVRTRRDVAMCGPLIALALLSACGGGGGPSSTPPPPPAAPPAPAPAPVNYDTAEYRASTGANFHGAITAYQAGASGTGVTVGVIDGGLSDPTGELAGRISAASRDFGGNGSIADVAGHGTAVTMAIAAGRNDRAIMGVAWNANVLALRTDMVNSCTPGDDSTCRFSTTAIANALDHAVANGAGVVNISLGGGGATNLLRQAVNRATAAGTIIVISAGNDSTSAPDALAQSLADPAISHGLVLIAAAVDRNGAHPSFSNGAQGFETVTISALGVAVPTIDNLGRQVFYSGTSMSAPLVSGAIALLRQAFPNLSSAQIVRLLLDSASDAGAAGADSVYGVGILDLARAFAPQGALRLAGGATPLSLGPSSLSAPMGDAVLSGQGVTGIATDSLGRAYGIDLKAGLRTAAPGLNLAPALRSGQRNLALGAGTARIALSLVANGAVGANLQPLALSPEQARGARLVAARIAARIAPGTDVAMGLSTGAAPLGAMLDGAGQAPFLIVRDGAVPTAEFRPGAALRVRQSIGGGFSLSAHAERGRVEGHQRDNRVRADDRGYDSYGLGVGWSRGALGLSAGAVRIAESGTTLGARFAPLLGAQSATTMMGHVSARLMPGGGWTFTGEWRRGWTRAAAGGLLRQGGRLTSEAWQVEAGRAGLFHPEDSLSFGLSRPLRVIASDFPLTLPTAYDYASGSASETIRILDLVPGGRAQDMELAYARPLGAGSLTLNLYRREQADNIAARPDEIGGAMRFALSF